MKNELNKITEKIIGAAIIVHRELGPGLLESAYEACLAYELAEHGLAVERQKPLPLVYRDMKLDCGYRLDILAEEKVIVELKAIERFGADPPGSASFISEDIRLSGGTAY